MEKFQERSIRKQASIEQQALYSRPNNLLLSIISRVEQYNDLAGNKQEANLYEQERLQHEIQIFTDRLNVLKQDEQTPSVEEINGKLQEITNAVQQLQNTNDPNAYFQRQGLLIRQAILNQRKSGFEFQSEQNSKERSNVSSSSTEIAWLKDVPSTPDKLEESLHFPEVLIDNLAEAMARTRGDAHEYSELTCFNRITRKYEQKGIFRGTRKDTGYASNYAATFHFLNPLTKNISFMHTHPRRAFFSAGDIFIARMVPAYPSIVVVGAVKAQNASAADADKVYVIIPSQQALTPPSSSQLKVIRQYAANFRNTARIEDIEVLGFGVYEWNNKHYGNIQPEHVKNGITLQRMYDTNRH